MIRLSHLRTVMLGQSSETSDPHRSVSRDRFVFRRPSLLFTATTFFKPYSFDIVVSFSTVTVRFTRQEGTNRGAKVRIADTGIRKCLPVLQRRHKVYVYCIGRRRRRRRTDRTGFCT